METTRNFDVRSLGFAWGALLPPAACSMCHTLLASGNLLHAVQSAAGLEPADLLLVERVVQLDAVGLAVGVLDLALERRARRKAVKAQDGDLVGRLDL